MLFKYQIYMKINYTNLENELKNIENDFEKALETFKNDGIFNKKEIVYTNDDKIRLKQKWILIKKVFLDLKNIIKVSKYRFMITWDYNNFVIKYYVTNMYYDNLLKLNKTFWIHEDFIRQQLEDRFKYNYNSIARYIYRFKFLYFLNYHKNFVLLLKDKIDKDLFWIIDKIKKQKDFQIEKRLFFDSTNIFYHIKYMVLNIAYYVVKYIWTLFSNIKISSRKWWLITKDSKKQYLKIAVSGDIILTRANWFWTNISIPGFWKHMSMYLWTWKYLEKNFPKYIDWLKKDKHYIIEAVWWWVRIVEFTDLCKHNDYLCVVRPRFSDDKKYRAIKQTLKSIWKKYDFLFNYYSDKSFVCSELITKSYLKDNENDEWLTINLEKIWLWITYPPNNLIKKLEQEHNLKNRELDPIIFIDSSEKTKLNFVNKNTDDLYNSWKRSRYSMFLK